MDIRKVKKLIELLEESGIAEIEISEGEESVRISRYPTGGGSAARRALRRAAAGTHAAAGCQCAGAAHVAQPRRRCTPRKPITP